MTWNPKPPAYPDEASRDAARAGYSDGFHGYPRVPADWPVQPYSRAFWEGKADAEDTGLTGSDLRVLDESRDLDERLATAERVTGEPGRHAWEDDE